MRFSDNFEHLLKLHLLSRDDGGIGDQGEVDPWVRHQVGLELIEVDVQGSIKPQRGGDGGDDLADQPAWIIKTLFSHYQHAGC